MALTNLYINKIVSDSTSLTAEDDIKNLYGVNTISCNGKTYYDGESIIAALLATNVDGNTAANIKAGAIIEYPTNTGKYWIALEDSTTDTSAGKSTIKLISKNVIAKRPYGNTNNFAKSQLFTNLNTMSATPGKADWKLVYPGLDGIPISELVGFDAKDKSGNSYVVAQNGEEDYVSEWESLSNRYVSLLSADEFKLYYDNDGVLKKDGASVGTNYWLITPSGCKTNEVVIVRNSNTLGSSECTYSCGVRPIIKIKVDSTTKFQVAQLGS